MNTLPSGSVGREIRFILILWPRGYFTVVGKIHIGLLATRYTHYCPRIVIGTFQILELALGFLVSAAISLCL